MLDDRLCSSPLDGTWEGFYDHDNKVYSAKNFPITATIEQQGRSIGGMMIDGVTDISHLYRMIVEANQGRMSAFDEDQASRLLEEFPDGIIESHLPEESRLEGRFAGGVIRFTKTYLGEYSTYGAFGGRRTLIRRVVDHRVHYEGVLTVEGATIEGKWTIRQPGILGRFLPPRDAGRFQLFRKA